MICEQEVVKMLARVTIMTMMVVVATAAPNYGDALMKSIMFFEGQRSGKLPPNQILNWRKDSALSDGSDKGVDLTGGYYDAGDNVKYNFPMAFSTIMLAWSVLEFGNSMGSDLQPALEAIRWSTDYFLKSTSTPGVVYAQVGDANADHNCWERPEDMDTPRTTYAVNTSTPGSEVSAEIAAALASSSMTFKDSDPKYSELLLKRASDVFNFADKYRGSYNDSIGYGVCPFYCDFGGYQDELIWGAAWLYKANKKKYYWNYVKQNINNLGGGYSDFGWDSKTAGINILVSKLILSVSPEASPFVPLADKFACSVLPESPSPTVTYSPCGLLFRPGLCNMQHTTSLSFLLLTYARYLEDSNRELQCDNFKTTHSRLIEVARNQVDYILGNNPMKMSYMVGYGEKFPQRIHHRGSSLPSVDDRKRPIKCKEGTPYFQSKHSNPNLLIGAVVGGPNMNDSFADDRVDAEHSEPTTYINAPLVGLLAYFKAH